MPPFHLPDTLRPPPTGDILRGSQVARLKFHRPDTEGYTLLAGEILTHRLTLRARIYILQYISVPYNRMYRAS